MRTQLPDRASRRRRAYRLGHRAEILALISLMVKGYRPIARRFSAAGGEIDLVMRRGRLIVFVEVKARASLDSARDAIDARKRTRFTAAVRAWLAREPWAAHGWSYRADAVLVAPRRWPVHVPEAFPLAGF